jgi:hypothetical protein
MAMVTAGRSTMASAEASGVSASSFSTTRTVSASGRENSQSPGGMDARIAACTDEVWPVPIVIDQPMTGCHNTVVTHGDTESDGAAFMTGCEGRDRQQALQRPVATPRILRSEMERNVAAVIELMDVGERPA